MFDLNKLKGFAQKQREQDNASGETFRETPEEPKEPDMKIDDEIYIPTDDEEDIGPRRSSIYLLCGRRQAVLCGSGQHL